MWASYRKRFFKKVSLPSAKLCANDILQGSSAHGKRREMEEDVRCLAAEHFNQGVSNPAWPTLSSIIDVCWCQTDESLSHSSDLGILSPTRPMTLIYINHRRLFFAQSNINTSTCKATWCPEYRWFWFMPGGLHFNWQDISETKRNKHPNLHWCCSTPLDLQFW